MIIKSSIIISYLVLVVKSTQQTVFSAEYDHPPPRSFPNPAFSFEVTQELLNQFLGFDTFEEVTSAMEGFVIPGMEKVPFGPFPNPIPVLLLPGKPTRLRGVLHRVRLQKAMLKPFVPNPEGVWIQEDVQGGQIIDKRPTNTLENKLGTQKIQSTFQDDPAENLRIGRRVPSLLYINGNHIRMALKGLNLVITTEYELNFEEDSGKVVKTSKGNLYARIKNAALIFNLVPSQQVDTGKPTAILRDSQVYLGDIQTKFQNSGIDWLSGMATSALEKLDIYLARTIENTLKSMMPTLFASIVSNIENSLLNVFSSLVTAHFPRTRSGLLMKNLRWKIENYKIMFLVNVVQRPLSLPSIERSLSAPVIPTSQLKSK